jgi:hypothetical protein
VLVGVFVAAAAFDLLVFVRDARIDPVPQSSLGIGVGGFRPEPLEQIGVEDPAVEIQSHVGRVAASIRLVRKEGGVPDAVLHVADADLERVDAELHHPVLDVVVQGLGIPLGEIPGVRRRIVPHRPPGGWRADHAGRPRAEPGCEPSRRRLDAREEAGR